MMTMAFVGTMDDRYVPLYLRQNANELTGERSIIMVKPLDRAAVESDDWIDRYT